MRVPAVAMVAVMAVTMADAGELKWVAVAIAVADAGDWLRGTVAMAMGEAMAMGVAMAMAMAAKASDGGWRRWALGPPDRRQALMPG